MAPTQVALACWAVGKAVAARPLRVAVGAERVAAVPLPLFLHSHPAARPGARKIPENKKGGGRGGLCSTRGGHYFFLSALLYEKPRVGDPPGVRAPGPRERAPRIAAATTCLPPVASGSGQWPCGRAAGALGIGEPGAGAQGHLFRVSSRGSALLWENTAHPLGSVWPRL